MIRVQTILLAITLMISIPSAASAGNLPDAGSLQVRQIEREFALFTADWIEKINRSYASRPDRVEIFPQGARYIGRYCIVENDSVLWSVKQVSLSPLAYIGLLEYLEWTFESTAWTQEEALRGPFIPVKGRRITEIFRYSQNRWQ
ncbi:MAG TPA: hypothetical protein ENN39_08580 [Desulfonatronum sp.]|nr:hypothetical protein [Desulfonatronum sp.]